MGHHGQGVEGDSAVAGGVGVREAGGSRHRIGGTDWAHGEICHDGLDRQADRQI